MADHDLQHLHARRDPSDPWDAIPFPGDNRSYPDKPPADLRAWELELLAREHDQLTGGGCTCGWCVYFEDQNAAGAFRLDVHAGDPDQPVVIDFFDAPTEDDEEGEAAIAQARQMLAELCARHGIAPDPDVVYGVLWIYNDGGHADYFTKISPSDPTDGA